MLALVTVAGLTGVVAIQALLREPGRGSRDVGRHRDMASIEKKSLAAGDVFFRPATTQIFGTRVEGGPYQGRFFVTSEQVRSMRGRSYPRRYTVREAKPNGSIGTVGEFQAHKSRSEAVRAAKEAT